MSSSPKSGAGPGSSRYGTANPQLRQTPAPSTVTSWRCRLRRGEVIDAQHPRNGPGRIGQGHDRPQQCLPAHPGMQCSSKTAPSPARERDGDSFQNLPGARRAAAVAHGMAVHLFGGCIPRTTNVRAVQPPHHQLDQYLPIPDRCVGKSSSVRAVHPVGHHRTRGASPPRPPAFSPPGEPLRPRRTSAPPATR